MYALREETDDDCGQSTALAERLGMPPGPHSRAPHSIKAPRTLIPLPNSLKLFPPEQSLIQGGNGGEAGGSQPCREKLHLGSGPATGQKACATSHQAARGNGGELPRPVPATTTGPLRPLSRSGRGGSCALVSVPAKQKGDKPFGLSPSDNLVSRKVRPCGGWPHRHPTARGRRGRSMRAQAHSSRSRCWQ